MTALFWTSSQPHLSSPCPLAVPFGYPAKLLDIDMAQITGRPRVRATVLGASPRVESDYAWTCRKQRTSLDHLFVHFQWIWCVPT